MINQKHLDPLHIKTRHLQSSGTCKGVPNNQDNFPHHIHLKESLNSNGISQQIHHLLYNEVDYIAQVKSVFAAWTNACAFSESGLKDP